MENIFNPIADVIDRSKEKLTAQDLNQPFLDVAKDLMCKHVLCIGEKKYRLAEIEFYLDEGETGSIEVFRHKQEGDIAELGVLRFHGSGVDISLKFGNYYGGVLIRSVVNLSNDNLFCGPLISLKEIFSGIDILKGTSCKFKITKENNGASEPLKSFRVGLNPFSEELKRRFPDKSENDFFKSRFLPWRFINSINVPHKFLIKRADKELTDEWFSMSEEYEKSFSIGKNKLPEKLKNNGDYFQLLGFAYTNDMV